MSLIMRNDYGAIAVNNKVISRMVVDALLDMSELIIPCNKKGKLIKDVQIPFGAGPFKEPLLDAVDISENKNGTKIKIYIVAQIGHSISDIADELIERTEEIYNTFEIKKPEHIDICVKGIMSNQLIKRNIEVSRTNV